MESCEQKKPRYIDQTNYHANRTYCKNLKKASAISYGCVTADWLEINVILAGSGRLEGCRVVADMRDSSHSRSVSQIYND